MVTNALNQREPGDFGPELRQLPGSSAGSTRERSDPPRPYDFRHPSKLSKDQLRTLQMIFEEFARMAGTNLSAVLRSQAHVTLTAIEQMVFQDYAGSLPQYTVLNVAAAAPLPGMFVVEFDLSTAFTIVDRLLGGVGKAPAQERQVTEIEAALLQSISSVFLDAFTEAWSHIMSLDTKLQRLEYSPRFLQLVPQNEPVVQVMYDLRLLERQTTLSMCIPYSVIEPVASNLTVETLLTASQSTNPEHDNLEPYLGLQRVTIPVTALLGSTRLPLSVINELEVGDVIRLDGSQTDPIIVTINRRPTYIARPGVIRNGLGVQILGVLSEDEVLFHG